MGVLDNRGTLRSDWADADKPELPRPNGLGGFNLLFAEGIENSGLIEVVAPLYIAGALNFNNSGEILVQTELYLKNSEVGFTNQSGGLLQTSPSPEHGGSKIVTILTNGGFFNDGLIRIGAPTEINASLIENTGTIQLEDQYLSIGQISNLGVIAGSGAIANFTGDVAIINQGIISPALAGDPEPQAGAAGVGDLGFLFIESVEFSSIGTYACDVGFGTEFPSSSDFLSVDDLELAGTLLIGLAPGYVPSFGDTFTVMEWGSREGEFDQIVIEGSDAFRAGGLFFTPTYTDFGLEIVAVPAPGAIGLLAVYGLMTGARIRRRRE